MKNSEKTIILITDGEGYEYSELMSLKRNSKKWNIGWIKNKEIEII